MVRAFERQAACLEASCGGPVHLVRQTGPRTAFVAGHVPEVMPFVAVQRVVLDDAWALLFYPAAGVQVDRDAVRALFKDVV